MQARNSSDTRTPHFADPLAFNAPDGGTGFPGTIAVKFCTQRMAKVQNGEEIAESFNPLSKAHERYRQTDRQQTDCNSRLERNVWVCYCRSCACQFMLPVHSFVIFHSYYRAYTVSTVCSRSGPWCGLWQQAAYTHYYTIASILILHLICRIMSESRKCSDCVGGAALPDPRSGLGAR